MRKIFVPEDNSILLLYLAHSLTSSLAMVENHASVFRSLKSFSSVKPMHIKGIQLRTRSYLSISNHRANEWCRTADMEPLLNSFTFSNLELNGVCHVLVPLRSLCFHFFFHSFNRQSFMLAILTVPRLQRL